jgi:lysophospholipase L1-like esterase
MMHPVILSMGDSISAPYHGWVDLNWVQLFRKYRSASLSFNDSCSYFGGTSDQMIAKGEPQKAVSLYHSNSINAVTLLIGGDDILANLVEVAKGNYANLVSSVAGNIALALNIMLQGGIKYIVLGYVPNIGLTPRIQQAFHNNPLALAHIQQCADSINTKLKAYCHGQGVPLVDTNGLLKLTQNSLLLGGVTVKDFWTPDQFHPGTVPSGLLGNTFLTAFFVGYGIALPGTVMLTDQEILDAKGIPHPVGNSHYNVLPYVIKA